MYSPDTPPAKKVVLGPVDVIAIAFGFIVKHLLSLLRLPVSNLIAFAVGFIVWFCVGTFTCKDGHGYFLSWDRQTNDNSDLGMWLGDICLFIVSLVIFGMGFRHSGWTGNLCIVYGVFCLGGGMIGSLVCVKNESWFTNSGSGGMRGWLARLF